MLRSFPVYSAAVAALLVAAPVFAENFEVHMLNKGTAGTMVFEPSELRIAPGDSVTFIAKDKGHNAESIEGMMPEGATPFAGKLNEEISVTFDKDGFYGVKCKPHYAMGMVMTIAVGEAKDAPESFLAGRIPKKAKERFEAQLGELAK